MKSKNYIFKFIFAVWLLALCLKLDAQPITGTTPELMLEVAEESEEINDYYNAVEWYENAFRERRDRKLAYTIGDLHYKLRDYKRAASYLKRIVETYDLNEDFPDARFKYGRVLKMNGEYEQAIEVLNEFKRTTQDPVLAQLAENELLGAEMAMEAQNINPELVIESLGRKVNTLSSEYSPNSMGDGTIVYAALRGKEPVVLDGKQGDYYTKIFSIAPRTEKTWQDPEEFGNGINRAGYHSSGVAFSLSKDEIFFTRSRTEGNKVIESKIFWADNTGGSWSAALECDGVNGDFISKHPYPGALFGNEVLFFSADIEGGYGGMDIYYATRKADGVYGEPKNLGERINTAGDEVTPYYFDGLLYFSSNGLPGFGGFDIFKTKWNETRWMVPESLEKGFNTRLDDVFFRFNDEDQTGFVVSNREGTRSIKSKTCCNDIYTFKYEPIAVQLIAGTYAQRRALDSATVSIFELQDGAPLEDPYFVLTNPSGHEYQFPLQRDKQYKVIAEKDGYFPDSTTISTLGIVESTELVEEFILTVVPVKEVEPEPEPADPEEEVITINQPIRLNKIYYDLDDDKILPDAEQDLNTLLDLLNQYPDMVIELGSHTDAQGNDDYNQDLSLRRSRSAKRWLVRKGISALRVKAVGYGEKVILNQCENGVKCTDDEHRFNRRTEFKILEGPTEIVIKRRKSDTGAIEISKEKKLPPRPIITYDHERWSFGEVKKGDSVTHEYSFTNTGDADLIIEIVTACQCTDLDYPALPIKPGEKGVIKATFNSSDQDLGDHDKDITVVANTSPIVTEIRYTATVTE